MKGPCRAAILAAALAGLPVSSSLGDCTLTNLGIKPLNDLGFGVYSNSTGGLYPNGANRRPPAHEAAGLAIGSNGVQPLDTAGNVDANRGRIVLLSIGMSNTTQEWASKGRNNFKRLADADRSKNAELLIVDGAQGGQDATPWTNYSAPTGSELQTQRLAGAGVTTLQDPV